MEKFLNLTLNGVSSGAVYAALGLSLVIIYRATRVVNFAQPAFALISAYLAYSINQKTGGALFGVRAADHPRPAPGAAARRAGARAGGAHPVRAALRPLRP